MEWLQLQQGAYQKLVDGYQKHLTEVKMARKNVLYVYFF